MDAYKAIVSKRDTRVFEDRPLDDETLGRVLQAGRMAGSAKNAQVTRVIVVTEPDTRQKLAACGDFTSWIGGAPVVLVLTMPIDGGRLFDLGRMAQNIMVAGHELGLGSCPLTFHHQDCIREVLGVPADQEGPMGIALGWPAPAPPSPLRGPRIPLDELVHRGRWRA